VPIGFHASAADCRPGAQGRCELGDIRLGQRGYSVTRNEPRTAIGQCVSDPVKYERVERVAVLFVDNPPVNALSPAVWDAIDRGIARAADDRAADAIVLIGSGPTFIAGTDIKSFDTLKTTDDSMRRSDHRHAILRRMEDCPKPLVAAIHGHALGGGNEVAMACHYRVISADAQIGQPEVRLGLIPGSAGTQRLPRLVGPELAMRMCTDGLPISAQEAVAAGAADVMATGDLLESAIRFATMRAAHGTTRKTRDLTDKILDQARAEQAARTVRTSIARTAQGQRAPHAALEAIEYGIQHTFDEGAIRERELFATCVVSIESKALRYLFFAERDAAKIPNVPSDTPARAIGSAAIVGAGTMGSGIAMTYANAGIPVLLKDVDPEALERGMATIRSNYESSVAKRKLTPDAMATSLALITPTTSYEGFGHVDIVVEAVFENMELKKSTFAELGRVTRPDCILASNTSTLDIDELAGASGRPDQVVGHHFFSPANVMKLLEIVRARRTSPETIAGSVRLAKRLGKVGVVVGNCFGFVANRLLAYYMREAYLLLEEGATAMQIDQALTAFGMPMGPFAMQDLAGIDVGARIRQHLKSMGKTRAEGPQSEVVDRLYELGRYGQKTGAGWYRYEHGSRTPIPDLLIDDLAAREAARRGITRRAVADEEIIARITTALVNEGARVLEEGYASRPGDIDVIFVHGFGFPRYRGGPMFHADTVGLPTMLRRVTEYRARFGDYWTPAPLLQQRVAEGRGFCAGAAA
jgi:3-hydroxyacyl-CoA dehydrogenase